jgi:beta-mannosidase
MPTGGFCVRALNDHTAESGWGVIDIHGNRRPAFAALRSACQPVVITIDALPATTTAGGRVSVAIHVASDLRHDIEGATVDVGITGSQLSQNQRFVGTIEADASSYIGTVTTVAPSDGNLEITATLTTDYGTSMTKTTSVVT